MSGKGFLNKDAPAAHRAVEIRSFPIADARFERGQRWVSASGYSLVFTDEGNLELHSRTAEVLWRTKTSAGNAAALLLKTSGDVVIVDWRGYPLWSTGTAGNEGAFLALQPDGNLVLYSADNRPLWETGTAGG